MRDFAQRRHTPITDHQLARPASQFSITGLSIIVVLILGLGLIGGALWLFKHPHSQPSNKPSMVIATQASPAKKSNKSLLAQKTMKPTSQEPVFDFYHVLPNSQVNVTKPKLEPSKRQFIVQVASYRKNQAAKDLQVKLILMGLKPTNTNQNGWHTVTLGPVDTLRKGDALRHQLEKQNIRGAFVKQLTNQV